MMDPHPGNPIFPLQETHRHEAGIYTAGPSQNNIRRSRELIIFDGCISIRNVYC